MPEASHASQSFPLRVPLSYLARMRAGGTPYAGPIVALTAYAMKDDARRFEEAGFDGYIAKPYSPRQLLATVREFLPEA